MTVIATPQGTAITAAPTEDTRITLTAYVVAWGRYGIDMGRYLAQSWVDTAQRLEGNHAARLAAPYVATAATIIGAAIWAVNL